MKTVFIPRAIHETGLEYLHEHGFATRGGSAIDERTLCCEVCGCEAILVRTANITRAVMEAEPNLKLIARHGTGMDIIDVPAATALGIQVTNTPQANGPSVAELTIGGMIAAARKLYPLAESAKRGDFFYKSHCQGGELAGKTLGLIGFGDIGCRVARMAALGFGMQVLVYRGHTEGKQIPDYVRLVDWDELFQTADFVSLHLPLRRETAGCIGKREFSMMKPTAVLINTARGQVVREEELVKALAQGALAGAFLDVLTTEPFPEDHPLLHMEQVIVTPHCGSNTKEALIRAAVDAAEDVNRFFHAEPVQWPVNHIPRRDA